MSSLTVCRTAIEPFVLARIAAEAGKNRPIIFVTRDGQRLADLEQALKFVAPDLPVLSFPGWDCLPYDRVSPGADTAARRLAALTSLMAFRSNPHRAVILTTVNALLQRMPPQERARIAGFLGQARQPGGHERIGAAAGEPWVRPGADRS